MAVVQKPQELWIAISKDWSDVKPAIFGTLLKRALNTRESSRLGAHYTPRAYVKRLVIPTIIEPLRSDCAIVQSQVKELQDRNDRAGALVAKRHYPQLMDTLKLQVTLRCEFERLKASDPQTLTDLEPAARFVYLRKLALGGKVAGQNFDVDRGGQARFNLTRLAPLLEDVHERLSDVAIENLDWLDFIARYDTPDTLFYLDMPYFGSEGD